MKSLQFGGGRETTISIEGPQGLIAGAGLHRLMFYVHVKAHGIPAGVPVALSGEAFLGGGLQTGSVPGQSSLRPSPGTTASPMSSLCCCL